MRSTSGSPSGFRQLPSQSFPWLPSILPWLPSKVIGFTSDSRNLSPTTYLAGNYESEPLGEDVLGLYRVHNWSEKDTKRTCIYGTREHRKCSESLTPWMYTFYALRQPLQLNAILRRLQESPHCLTCHHTFTRALSHLYSWTVCWSTTVKKSSRECKHVDCLWSMR
jgi:hypothetical protein